MMPGDDEPLPNAPDGASPRVVLRYVRMCAEGWAPEARLLGNVRADDIVRAVTAILEEPPKEAKPTGAAFCSHCDWHLLYDADNPVAVAEAASQLGMHACGCDRNPSVAKLVSLQEEIAQLKAERDEAMRVLSPNMPESGLVDACKQVKQVAISEADNSTLLEARLSALLDEPLLTDDYHDIEEGERVVRVYRNGSYLVEGPKPRGRRRYSFSDEHPSSPLPAREALAQDAIAARAQRFNDTTGALTWNYRSAALHPDRCECQGDETTPHKHYSDPPYSCARCVKCKGYQPAAALSSPSPSASEYARLSAQEPRHKPTCMATDRDGRLIYTTNGACTCGL